MITETLAQILKASTANSSFFLYFFYWISCHYFHASILKSKPIYCFPRKREFPPRTDKFCWDHFTYFERSFLMTFTLSSNTNLFSCYHFHRTTTYSAPLVITKFKTKLNEQVNQEPLFIPTRFTYIQNTMNCFGVD